MKDKPVRVGLATFWAKLGVQSDGAIVRFDDSATLAAIRRAITMAESNAVDEPSCFSDLSQSLQGVL
jgi:hypothetical protein